MPVFFLVAALLLLGGVATAKVVKGLSPKIVRSLDELDPAFRKRFEAFLSAAKASGKPLIVAETWRSPARQAWLYGSGRASYLYEGFEYGRPGESWLTDRDPLHPSEHQKRLAADTIPGLKWKGDDEFRAYMMALVPLAKTFGLKNLGAKDAGHWENA